MSLSGLSRHDRDGFERLYGKYNKREYVHPDPLEFLFKYNSAGDREVAGMVASVLAYGRVEQILKSVGRVLDIMGPHPADFLKSARPSVLERSLAGFKHRFTTGAELSAMLQAVRAARKEYGSLNEAFVACMQPGDRDILPGLVKFAGLLNPQRSYLLPSPSDGSACKRVNLYLRWMVRSDEVDPGGWKGVGADKLVIPLDTHMARIGGMLGMTARKNAGLRMVMDITESFRKIVPADPVRYDFVLTRFGIRADFRARAHG